MTNSWHLVTKVLVTRHQCSIPSEEYSATHTGAVSGLREEQNLNIWGAQLCPMGVIRALLLLLPLTTLQHTLSPEYTGHTSLCVLGTVTAVSVPHTLPLVTPGPLMT